MSEKATDRFLFWEISPTVTLFFFLRNGFSKGLQAIVSEFLSWYN